MAQIAPFKGYRFNIDKPQDLGKLIAPPYDMLDSTMVDALYARDPHNTVRITQNRPEPSDTQNRDRHHRAAGFFDEWSRSGTLVRDSQPGIYVYEQQFTIDQGGSATTFTRTGVIVSVKLVDFSEGVVLPHEQTLSGPKKDRYELLDETRVNTGQIFGLLQDSGDAYSAIRSCMTGQALGTSTDENGVKHSVYRCSDPALIQKLIDLAAPRTILIADGHHRYETALNFSREHSDNPAYGWTMMTLVSMADPGLVIRPFHRLIRRKTGAESLNMLSELGKYFLVKDLGPAQESVITGFVGSRADNSMLYVDTDNKRAYEIALSSGGETYLKDALPERSELWKHLDVSKINQIVIARILELPLDGHVLHDMVEYVNDARAGLGHVISDTGFYGGFFIRPLTIKAVYDIVAGGERMPQKSTNFFPKLYSGLVFNKLDGA